MQCTEDHSSKKRVNSDVCLAGGDKKRLSSDDEEVNTYEEETQCNPLMDDIHGVTGHVEDLPDCEVQLLVENSLTRTDGEIESSEDEERNRPTSPIFKSVSAVAKHLRDCREYHSCPLVFHEQVKDTLEPRNCVNVTGTTDTDTTDSDSSQSLFCSLSPSAATNRPPKSLATPSPLKACVGSTALLWDESCCDEIECEVGTGEDELDLSSPRNSVEEGAFDRSVPAPWPVIEQLLNAL
jgi:hypothetical protein